MRVVVVLFLSGLLALGYLAYRSPRVRELFESAPPRPKPAAVSPAPSQPSAAPARTVPPAAQPAPPKKSPEKPSATRGNPAPSVPPPHQPPPQPTVSNAEVSSVLMGIFRARQIYGVSLAVSDTEIEVAGEVVSEAQRRQVLETIEKAREYRRVIAKDLKVRHP